RVHRAHVVLVQPDLAVGRPVGRGGVQVPRRGQHLVDAQPEDVARQDRRPLRTPGAARPRLASPPPRPRTPRTPTRCPPASTPPRPDASPATMPNDDHAAQPTTPPPNSPPTKKARLIGGPRSQVEPGGIEPTKNGLCGLGNGA